MRQPLHSQKRPAPASGHPSAPESPFGGGPWSSVSDLADLLPAIDQSTLDDVLGPLVDLDELLGPAVDLSDLLGEGGNRIL